MLLPSREAALCNCQARQPAAMLRGDLHRRTVPIKCVRIEPYVIPKTSLTVATTDRVDTRVTHVIYAIDPNELLVKERKVLVGRLLDVFIDVK